MKYGMYGSKLINNKNEFKNRIFPKIGSVEGSVSL